MKPVLEKPPWGKEVSFSPPSFLPKRQEERRICQGGKTGAEAGRLLARPGFSGTVLAALPGTIYMMSDEEEILWLSTDRFPLHRRSLQVSFLPPPQPGFPRSRFWVRNSFLLLNDFLSVDLGSLKQWTPPIFLDRAKPLEMMRAHLGQLLAFLQGFASGKGLGRFIPMMRQMAEGKEISLPSCDFADRRFLLPLLEIGNACRRRNLDEILRKGKELIGLGPGLTPSGDDFLGGLLFSVFHLREAYPDFFFWDPKRVADFTASIRLQTNPISYVFLNDFALGHGPDPLHQLMNFLFWGNDFENAASAVIQFLGFGHSSGGDILAGLMTGMLMVFELQK